jgi:hypothetical protein
MLQFFGTTRLLAISPSVLGFSFMIFGLGILALTLVLQVINQLASLIFQTNHSPNPKKSHLVTKVGIFYKPLACTLHPSKVTPEGSFVVESSITKTRGVIAKVKVVLTPNCVSLVTLVVGFSQAIVYAITR